MGDSDWVFLVDDVVEIVKEKLGSVQCKVYIGLHFIEDSTIKVHVRPYPRISIIGLMREFSVELTCENNHCKSKILERLLSLRKGKVEYMEWSLWDYVSHWIPDEILVRNGIWGLRKLKIPETDSYDISIKGVFGRWIADGAAGPTISGPCFWNVNIIGPLPSRVIEILKGMASMIRLRREGRSI